jgi:transcriptional regulator with XRE-family HTH domain
MIGIGIKIKELRQNKNLTQIQLGEILNVSGDAVSTWEIEKHYPDIHTLILLAKYFEVTADYLLCLKDY